MKNKNPENLSAASLVEMAKESHQKVMKEAEKRERAHKQKVAGLTAKEKGLKAKIEADKKQLEKMITDFEILEREQKEVNLAKIKKNEMTEADVRSGKISIKQFQSQGMKADEIKKEVITRTLEALEKSSDAVRGKGEEVKKAGYLYWHTFR